MPSVSNIVYGTAVQAKLETVTGGGLQVGAVFPATPASATLSGNLVITYTPGFNKLDYTGQYEPATPAHTFSNYAIKSGIAFSKSKNMDIILAMWDAENKYMGFLNAGGQEVIATTWNWVTRPVDRINNGKKEIDAISDSEIGNYKITSITTTKVGGGVTLYLPYLMGIEKIKEPEPEPEPDPCSIGPGLSSTSIASCIQASSQKYLDGEEKDWRRSVIKVNSLNA